MRDDVLGPPYDRSPEFEVVVERDVMVPLRDSVRLATDLYFPAIDGKAVPGPHPAVLLRTPYDKSTNPPDGEYFARRG